MGQLRDLIDKGVRIVGTPADGAATTAAADRSLSTQAYESLPPAAPSRSTVPVDIEDWGAVYEEAGLRTPPRGYGMDKVAEMLESKRLAPLAKEAKRAAVLAALEAAGVSLRDVVQDGVLRDQALDAFEAAKEREVQELRARTEGRIQSIKQEMDTVLRERNAELESLKRTSEEAARAFDQLQDRMQREEARLYEVLSHFLAPEQNPIPGSRAEGSPPRH